MLVREAMTAIFLTVGPDHTLRQAAELMAERNVGAALVRTPERPGPGIITERDVLRSIAAGEDPDVERVDAHLTGDATVATPDSSLDEAARAMVRGGFRHLVVVDGGTEVLGVLSMRDIVRSEVEAGRTVPGQVTS